MDKAPDKLCQISGIVLEMETCETTGTVSLGNVSVSLRGTNHSAVFPITHGLCKDQQRHTHFVLHTSSLLQPLASGTCERYHTVLAVEPSRGSRSPCPSLTLRAVDQTGLQVACLCSRQNKSCRASNLLPVPSQSAVGGAWLSSHGAVTEQSPEVKGLLKHTLTPAFAVFAEYWIEYRDDRPNLWGSRAVARAGARRNWLQKSAGITRPCRNLCPCLVRYDW